MVCSQTGGAGVISKATSLTRLAPWLGTRTQPGGTGRLAQLGSLDLSMGSLSKGARLARLPTLWLRAPVSASRERVSGEGVSLYLLLWSSLRNQEGSLLARSVP